jgi:hypothetical protein
VAIRWLRAREPKRDQTILVCDLGAYQKATGGVVQPRQPAISIKLGRILFSRRNLSQGHNRSRICTGDRIRCYWGLKYYSLLRVTVWNNEAFMSTKLRFALPFSRARPLLIKVLLAIGTRSKTLHPIGTTFISSAPEQPQVGLLSVYCPSHSQVQSCRSNPEGTSPLRSRSVPV